jgi:hypothetical protein
MRLIVRLVVPAILATACVPAPAAAQVYGGGYLGMNHNSPADVTIAQPALNTQLVFHDVSFESQPFHFPMYGGGRAGYLFSPRFGLEFEFLHLKVIAETDRATRTTGTLQGATIDQTSPMDFFAQRYEMTHGLNFLLANVVWRTPIAKRAARHPVSLVVRGGAGPTVSGTDTEVNFIDVHRYEHAGFGVQAAAGLDLPIAGAWSAIVDFRFTYSKPTITVTEGQGQTSARASQISFGLAVGFSR